MSSGKKKYLIDKYNSPEEKRLRLLEEEEEKRQGLLQKEEEHKRQDLMQKEEEENRRFLQAQEDKKREELLKKQTEEHADCRPEIQQTPAPSYHIQKLTGIIPQVNTGNVAHNARDLVKQDKERKVAEVAEKRKANALRKKEIARAKAVELGGGLTDKVSQISRRRFRDGFSSTVHSATTGTLTNSSPYYGHEQIPESSPTEQSSLRNTGGRGTINSNSENWEDRGSDWGSGDYQSQEKSASSSSSKPKSSEKNGKSDD